MNTLAPSRIITLVLCLCTALVSASICDPTDSTNPPAPKPPADSPFILLSDVPNSVDAAIVLNNPASHILLNDSGKTVRKLLAFAGVFTHTEHAWDALAKAFNANTEDTINALLSQRVVVMWDEIAPSTDSSTGFSVGSFMKFANAIDTQWVLSCEVESAYLKEIRARLKPVRRGIEQGHTVYAIEQGRYEIVLINPSPDQQRSAAVILAPKAARSLLIDVLAQRAPIKPTGLPSIIEHRAPLLESLTHADSSWQAAWVVQFDRPEQGESDGDEQFQSSSVFVGVLSSNPELGITATFASDHQFDLPSTNAPVGLLSVVGDDAILAVALAQTPTIIIDNSAIHYQFELQSGSNPKASSDTPSQYSGGPGLILFSKITQGNHTESDDTPVVLTIMTGLDLGPTPAEPLAVQGDQVIYNLFASLNPTNAPNYQGRFPGAVRTHTLDAQANAQTQRASIWPGDHAKFSWFASDLPDAPSLITTLGPEHADTARQVRWIAQAARTLDAIPDHTHCKATITQGYFYPSRATKLIDSSSPIDLVLSQMIERIEWEITRTPVGIAGTTTIKLSDLSGLTQLGKTNSQ